MQSVQPVSYRSRATVPRRFKPRSAQQDVLQQVQDLRVLIESKASTEFAAGYGKDVQDRVEDKTSAALTRFEATLKEETKAMKESIKDQLRPLARVTVLEQNLIKLQASFDMACTLGGAAFAVPLSVSAVTWTFSNVDTTALKSATAFNVAKSVFWVTLSLLVATGVFVLLATRIWRFFRPTPAAEPAAVGA